MFYGDEQMVNDWLEARILPKLRFVAASQPVVSQPEQAAQLSEIPSGDGRR
jgi:hypothetical protein